MQKNRLNKQKVFDAAKSMAHLDKEPTTSNIREYLSYTGSQTTLHKYLKEWKLKCFKAYKDVGINGTEAQEVTTLQTENQKLIEKLAQMEEHGKVVASEFARTERKNVELTQRLMQVEGELNSREKELREIKKDKEHADNLYRDLKEEREVLLGRMERDKDQLIESLQKELNQAHREDLQKIQDVSYHGHDLLMQEKVKVLNLEEKVKGLSDELAKLQQEFNNANRVVEPLKNQIKQLEKLIAENITSEQLKEYEKKQQFLAFMGNKV